MEVLKIIITAASSAAALFIIAKIMGHKQMAQLDLFDYICGITIGSIAAEMATELENPLKPLIAMSVYGAVSVTLSIVTQKFPKARKFINGTPTIIMHGGKIYRKNIKKARLELSEFMVLCRQQGYFNLDDIGTAVFEHNGNLTIMPKSGKRPLEPSDIGIVPPVERFDTEVIMDGRILDENLKRVGLDKRWLERALRERGVGDVKDVFLGVCGANNTLTLFVNE